MSPSVSDQSLSDLAVLIEKGKTFQLVITLFEKVFFFFLRFDLQCFTKIFPSEFLVLLLGTSLKICGMGYRQCRYKF